MAHARKARPRSLSQHTWVPSIPGCWAAWNQPCFLEYEAGSVVVHDLLHERDNEAWRLRVSSYRKLRLAPHWLTVELAQCGLTVAADSGSAGLVRLTARQNFS